MKYRVFKAKRFRKNLKKMLRRGKDENKLNAVVLKLAQGEVLPPQYKDHARSVEELTGRSIRIYGSAAVAAKFKDVRCVRPFARYAIDTIDFFAVPMEHDATCYAYCIRSVKTGDTLLYATDTKRMTEYIDGLGQMIIESNYNVEVLENGEKKQIFAGEVL